MTCPRASRGVYLPIEEETDDEHVAGCADCQEARRAVARIREAAPSVGAALRPPPGWQARVLAEIDRGTAQRPRATRSVTRWRVAVPVALAAAAALLLVWLSTRAPEQPRLAALSIELSVTGGPAPRRADNAAVGDVVEVRVGGVASAAALWIYRDGATLILRCPGDAGCKAGNGQLTAQLRVDRPGIYQVLATSADAALPPPPATLDEGIRAAALAKARYQLAELEVF